MTRGPDPFGTDAWRAWSAPAGNAWETRAPGPDALAAWCLRVADELREALLAAPADPVAVERFAAAFFLGGPRSWPAFGAFDTPGAFGSGTAASIPATGATAPALGPAREHQQRAAALARALAELAAARDALAPLLGEAARVAATAFGTRVRDAGPLGARATFDLWIECAEAAWQDLAHGEGWCRAQARAFDAALSVVACQREIAAHAARLAGLPGRDEIDDLHRRVRDLERGR